MTNRTPLPYRQHHTITRLAGGTLKNLVSTPHKGSGHNTCATRWAEDGTVIAPATTGDKAHSTQIAREDAHVGRAAHHLHFTRASTLQRGDLFCSISKRLGERKCEERHPTSWFPRHTAMLGDSHVSALFKNMSASSVLGRSIGRRFNPRSGWATRPC